MAQGKFRTIIFDIGRVLVRVDAARAMEGLAVGLALTPQEAGSNVELPGHPR